MNSNMYTCAWCEASGSKPTATNINSVFRRIISNGINMRVITNRALFKNTPHILKSYIPND